MSALYLDTHAVIFLYSGLTEKFTKKTLKLIGESELLFSPIAFLECQYLYEIGRLNCMPQKILVELSTSLDFKISSQAFDRVILQASNESWTRDVFDRIITAQARVDNLPLLTKDRLIQANYSHAFWD